MPQSPVTIPTRSCAPPKKPLVAPGKPASTACSRKDRNRGASRVPRDATERQGVWGPSRPPCKSISKPAAASRGALAQAEGLRGDLQQLVLADPLEALLEVHGARRRELDA